LQGIVSVKFFAASVIKTYLNDSAITVRIAERQICQPIMNIHAIASATAASTIAFTSVWCTRTTTRTTHNKFNKDEKIGICRKYNSCYVKALAGKGCA
jgi:hypothetical protein